MPKFPTLAHIDFAYTAVPDYFLDHIAPTLKEGELKVMLYILRRTLGYRKLSDSISYDQFIKGITTREGKRLDQGAGVSRRAVVTALASLEEKGLIKRSSGGYKSAATISLSLPCLTTLAAPANEQNVLALVSKDGAASVNPTTPSIGKNLPAPKDNKEQNLHAANEKVNAPQRQNLPADGQILPSVEAQSAQILHPTLDNHDQKRVSQPTEAVLAADYSRQQVSVHEKVSPDEQEEAARLIASQVIGIGQPEAERLAHLVFQNGRSLDYVKLLVDYVTTTPSIRVPAAVLTTLIKTNQERQAQPDTLQPANTRFKVISSAKTSFYSIPADLDGEPISTLTQAELNEIWGACCRRLAERWQFEPTSLGSGSLILAEHDNTALILTVPCPDSLLRIRISQLVRELLQERGFYSYRLIW